MPFQQNESMKAHQWKLARSVGYFTKDRVRPTRCLRWARWARPLESSGIKLQTRACPGNPWQAQEKCVVLSTAIEAHMGIVLKWP